LYAPWLRASVLHPSSALNCHVLRACGTSGSCYL
jgi:hypothetical protein